jgi:hypothetical protein
MKSNATAYCFVPQIRPKSVEICEGITRALSPNGEKYWRKLDLIEAVMNVRGSTPGQSPGRLNILSFFLCSSHAELTDAGLLPSTAVFALFLRLFKAGSIIPIFHLQFSMLSPVFMGLTLSGDPATIEQIVPQSGR